MVNSDLLVPKVWLFDWKKKPKVIQNVFLLGTKEGHDLVDLETWKLHLWRQSQTTHSGKPFTHLSETSDGQAGHDGTYLWFTYSETEARALLWVQSHSRLQSKSRASLKLLNETLSGKALVTKPFDLSSISGTHKAKRNNFCKLLCDLHMQAIVLLYPHTY